MVFPFANRLLKQGDPKNYKFPRNRMLAEGKGWNLDISQRKNLPPRKSSDNLLDQPAGQNRAQTIMGQWLVSTSVALNTDLGVSYWASLPVSLLNLATWKSTFIWFIMVFIMTSLFNWCIEDRRQSLAHSDCQDASCSLFSWAPWQCPSSLWWQWCPLRCEESLPLGLRLTQMWPWTRLLPFFWRMPLPWSLCFSIIEFPSS